MNLLALLARRVLRADRRGSSWPVLVETDAGIFSAKLRGAAQAPAALVAEVIVGELAEALGLNVPLRVLIDISPGIARDDLNDELAQLLAASTGRNLGFQYLSDARDFSPDDVLRVDTEVATAIAWLDGFILNPDRTDANPNLLWSHDRLWLIDHGASLGFQHDWTAVTEESPRVRGPSLSRHVLRSRAIHLVADDERLSGLLDRTALERAVEAVPAEFLPSDPDPDAMRRRRAAYVAFLWKRLKPPRPWLG